MKVSFYLKRPGEAQTSLFCIYFHDGKRTKIYLNISIETKHWDSKEQKAKTRNNPSGTAINKEIEHIKTTLTNFYNDCRAKGYLPSDNDLKACIKPVQAEDRQLGFWDAWGQYYGAKATTKPMRQKLDAIRGWLESFEHKRGALHLDSISWATLEDLQAHLTRMGLQLGTVAKHTGFVKAFLHWCVSREITANVKWQRFCIQAPPDTLKVALSRAELDRIRNAPLPHDHLRNARDLFLIGCLTGLRFSDFTRIKPEHIKGGMLIMRQQKTDGFVEIPLTDEAAGLVDGLATGRTRVITNQRMNGYLKQVCKLADIDDDFEVHEFRGKSKTTRTLPKWQLIGTHTARRTFATNLLLAGIPAQVVMQYTGHKDYKSFAKYVNIPRQSQHQSVREAIKLMA